MENCVFCNIIKGEIPSGKEFEDSDVVAFRDINPVAPIHVLVVPKKHIKNLADASPKDERVLGKIQLTAAKLAKKLGVGGAFRIIMANGEFAGQSVHHLHYHLIGGWDHKLTDKELKRHNIPGGLRK